MQDIFIGRQPIYNRNLGIHGYEMLFRANSESSANRQFSESGVSSQVIINTFLDMGLENLVGNSMASINLTERFLLSEDALPLPPERVILDIQAHTAINEHTLSALHKLKQAGFTLALEDFHDSPQFSELLRIADIFKINTDNTTTNGINLHIKKIKPFNLLLLAEKVETLDEYECYMDMGFEYFQGYFLSKPRIIKSKTLTTGKLSIMQLLSTLHSAASDIDSIEKAIASDLSLSYKLLKLLNSAFFNLPSEIDSIKRAVVFLGRKKLAGWASMLALSSMNDRPLELVKIAMVRAKTCELIAKILKLNDEDQFFAAGMFSALDILMEQSIESLIKPLPLADEIKLAILEYKGNIGTVVKCSQLLETSDAEKLSIKGISNAELSALYLQADNWALEVTQTIK
jgi:c-di-GMP-related signal transduction protein